MNNKNNKNLDVVDGKFRLEISKPPNNEDEDKLNVKPSGYFRYLLMIACGITQGFMFLNRSSVAVSILSMVNHTHVAMHGPNHVANGDSEVDDTGLFLWNNEIQQLIISSYMLAYVLPQIPGTNLAIRIGARKSMLYSLAGLSIANGLTPLVAYEGWKYVVVLRCLNGIASSITLPITLHLIEQWLPPNERAIGFLIVQQIGNSMTMSTPMFSGFLSSLHWKYSFYVPSGLALLYCIVWILITTDDICDNKLLSSKERLYILTQRSIDSSKNDKSAKTNNAQTYHWSYLFKIAPTYLFSFSWILVGFNGSTISSFIIPKYLHDTLNIDIQTNGLLTFLINSGQLVTIPLIYFIVPFLSTRLSLSTSNARKLAMVMFNAIGLSAFAYIMVFQEHQVILLAISRTFIHANENFIVVCLMDKFASTGLSAILYSIINTICCTTVALLCLAVGAYLDYSQTLSDAWTNIFAVSLGGSIALVVVFVFFLDSERLVQSHEEEAIASPIDEIKQKQLELRRTLSTISGFEVISTENIKL